MKIEDMEVGKLYKVSGDGIAEGFVYKDILNEVWYGTTGLWNPIQCFKQEFQDKILRNVI